MNKRDDKPTAKAAEAEPVLEAGQEVPKYRQCPLCFNGPMNGTGVAYCTQGSTRYYKCKCCGHTWTATVKTEVINIGHRIVGLDGERSGP